MMIRSRRATRSPQRLQKSEALIAIHLIPYFIYANLLKTASYNSLECHSEYTCCSFGLPNGFEY